MTEWFEDEDFWEKLYPFLFPDERFEIAEEQVGKLLDLVAFEGSTVLDLAFTLNGMFEVYGCGPTDMLKGCHHFASDREMTCWVSMEQTMGCGMGACMGCVVRTVGTTGYARTCKEGPIFESREIRWT